MTYDFVELKKKALEKYFSDLNPQQQKAVFKINGPLLILAGAGSGKTTVLINRIANMIFFGDAYSCDDGIDHSDDECRFLESYANGETKDSAKLADIVAHNTINPWNILAITFTNKAANELKSRLSFMLGDEGEKIAAATFHSACVRILRRECEVLGYSSNFTIYDTDDSQRVIKDILKDLDISDKMFPPKIILTEISNRKDTMTDAQTFEQIAASDYRLLTIAKVYKEYQHRLKIANAMDFDDIIFNTVTLFENYPDVLDHYQSLYKFIMVDEYQDTNTTQFKLVELLARKFGNICVVGDDDQSIYKFRGATIENILGFEEQFGCDTEYSAALTSLSSIMPQEKVKTSGQTQATAKKSCFIKQPMKKARLSLLPSRYLMMSETAENIAIMPYFTGLMLCQTALSVRLCKAESRIRYSEVLSSTTTRKYAIYLHICRSSTTIPIC